MAEGEVMVQRFGEIETKALEKIRLQRHCRTLLEREGKNETTRVNFSCLCSIHKRC